MHLAPEFGLTYTEIEQDGFPIDRRVEMLLSGDTPVAIAKSMGLGMIGVADALSELEPDILVLLGDRFEVFAAAAAALVARVPVAHLHGGELTEGAFDDAMRHAVTKLAHLHFVAAEPYRDRVIQLGEDPATVFNVGGLGVDGIRRLRLLSRAEVERRLEFTFGSRSLLVTFHPATLDEQDAGAQMEELISALAALNDTQILLTMPNADTGGRALMKQIHQFAAGQPNVSVFTSLGQLCYLSCVQFVDAVVGNSSSGLTEVPTFGKPTINIGDRQRGRIRGPSVIDCAPERDSIASAIRRAYDPAFRAQIASGTNPYGDGGASRRIAEVLRMHPLAQITRKRFHDIVR